MGDQGAVDSAQIGQLTTVGVHINQSPERSLIGEVNGASYGATQAFDGMRGSVRTPVYQPTEASAMKAAEPGAITMLSGPPSPARQDDGRPDTPGNG